VTVARAKLDPTAANSNNPPNVVQRLIGGRNSWLLTGDKLSTEIACIDRGDWEAAALEIGENETTPLAKTVRTCRNLLKLFDSLWLFVREEGVEPTNNAAERAIRPAVIWRRTSFGSDSAAGSEFVSRLLTVVSSLKAQERNILDFLAESVAAARSGGSPPSLLP
jgi:hypothetical protein